VKGDLFDELSGDDFLISLKHGSLY